MDSDWAWRAEIFVLWSEGALLYSALCVSITAGVPPHVARTKNVYALHVLYMRAPMAAHASHSKTLAERAGLVNRQASAISAQRFCQWDNGHPAGKMYPRRARTLRRRKAPCQISTSACLRHSGGEEAYICIHRQRISVYNNHAANDCLLTGERRALQPTARGRSEVPVYVRQGNKGVNRRTKLARGTHAILD